MDVEPTLRGRVGSRSALLLGAERKKTFFAMLSLTRLDRKKRSQRRHKEEREERGDVWLDVVGER